MEVESLCGLNILLVEKGERAAKIFDLLGEIMDEEHITHVSSLTDARRELRNGSFDVVLLNPILPGSGTVGPIQALLLESEEPVPCIILVEAKDEMVGINATKEGAEDYLIKEQLDTNLLSRSLRYSVGSSSLKKKIAELTLEDERTGLLNSKGFARISRRELGLAKRAKRRMFLLFVEIDSKEWLENDIDGEKRRLAIDGTAGILKETFRDTDIIAFLGGGRFAGLAVDAVMDGTMVIYTRVEDNIATFNAKKELGFDLSLRTGIVIFEPEKPRTIEELMEDAEDLMLKS